MIIWLNGAFGAGKTQTAWELRRRMADAYVYDPENAGFFIRKNLPPSLLTGDFQDYPMWRAFNLDMRAHRPPVSEFRPPAHHPVRRQGNAAKKAGLPAGGPPVLGRAADRPVHPCL